MVTVICHRYSHQLRCHEDWRQDDGYKWGCNYAVSGGMSGGGCCG